MRKITARSLTIGLAVLLVCGCSSSRGGGKSLSWSSLNPATYFAKSDSDSPVPMPSDQMAPTVTMPNATDVASTGGTGGTAPLSPYGPNSLGSSPVNHSNEFPQSPAPGGSLSAIMPQQGMYDPNGYAGSGTPVSQTSFGTTPYQMPAPNDTLTYNTAPNGYQMPQPPIGVSPAGGLNSTAPPRYGLGGGTYDIQAQPGLGGYAGTNTLPPAAEYAPAAPRYGNNGALGTNPATGYQLPPMQGQNPAWGSGASMNPADTYAQGAMPGPQRRDMGGVATLPTNPPVATPQARTLQTPYTPGQSNYNPPNTPSYTPPLTGGYIQSSPASPPQAGGYAPGSISRVPEATTPATSPYPASGTMY